MYKCCWNCENGFRVCAKTREESERINASKRVCEAPYPVSIHLENPFKQRFCKQFWAKNDNTDLINKETAERLNKMTPEELVKYWRALR